MTASIPSWRPSRETTGTPPPPIATTRIPRSSRVLPHDPAAFPFESPSLFGVVERPDRLRRVLEGGIGFVHLHSRHDHSHGPARSRLQLGGDERADLGLRLSDGDVERQRRSLRAGKLLAEKLVSDLWPVPVRDHEGPVAEEWLDRAERGREVRPLLGRRPALARLHEGVASEGDDG
jgi:hypothetical protein